jgi:hypothetical protein
VTRYESLRTVILGEAFCDGMEGLHILRNQGMAFWLRSIGSLPVPSPTSDSGPMPAGSLLPHKPMVALLATMLLQIVNTGGLLDR